MNLNVTLEFACYTQYGVYVYILIYGKLQGLLLPHFAVESYFTQISKQKQVSYYHETQHQNKL